MEEFQTQKSKKKQQRAQKDQIRGSVKEQFFNQLFICRPFPKSSNPTLEVVVVSLGLVHLLIIFVTFRILNKTPRFYGLELISFQKMLNIKFLPILSLANLFLKLIIISCLVFDHHLHNRKINQRILYQLIQQIRQYLRAAIQLDFTLSAILLITTQLISIFNFIGSVFIIGFSLICLENYCIKKDAFYIGSAKMYLLVRLCTVVGSLTTFICLNLSQNPNSLLIFLIVHSGFAFCITGTYFRKGFMIYRANAPKWGFIFHVIFLNSMLLNMWISLLSEEEFQVFLFPLFLTVIVVGIFLHFKLEKKTAESIPSCDDIEAQSNHLLESLQQSHYSIEVKAFVVGTRLITSILKFYLKCRQETHLANYPKDFQAMLHYCEFIYNSFKNLGLCLYWLRKLSGNRSHLSLFMKIKLNSLIAKIKQDNSFFLGQVYASNLQIEGLIEAQEVHSRITAETQNLLLEQMSVWQILEHEDVDLSLLRRQLEQIFTRINSNSNRWKDISDYVQQSARWRSEYLFFAKFLKNQRLKNRTLERFGLSLAKDNHRDKEKQDFMSISNIDLFDCDSCCLHTMIYKGEIIIKRVSRHFRDITGYEADEAIMSNLKIIMPKLILQGHNQMVIEMSANSKFYNQELYSTNKVYILNKEGFIIPVLKMYKELVTAQGNLEYVCFLKKTNERQCAILCDQNFQTHGLTKEAVQWIAGDSAEDEFIKCVNLISLIPGLARHSRFQGNLFSKENTVSSLKSLSFHKKIGDEGCSIQKQAYSNLFHSKSTNKVQGKYQLIYPQSRFQQYAISYQNHISNVDLGDNIKYYECIKRLTNKIMQGEHQKISCELMLNQIKNGSMHFYQVKLVNISSKRFHRQNSSQMMPVSSGIDLQLPVSTKELGFNDKTTNLALENVNIFIKEASNQALQSNSYIKYASTVWIIFFIAFSLVFVSRVTLMYSRYYQMCKYAHNQDSTVQASIFSSRLANEYQLLLMNVSLVDGEDSSMEIKGLTEELKSVINSVTMKEVIFDQAFSTHSHYPAKSATAGNFDQIDFLYFMEGLVQTLSLGHQLNTKTQRHLQNMYIDHQYPSLINCLNQTRYMIARNFKQEQALIKGDYIGFFLLGALVVLLSLALITCITYRFFKSMIEMVNIHCHFSPKDVDKIKKYLTNIYDIFEHMRKGQISVDTRHTNIQKSPTRQPKRNPSYKSESSQRNEHQNGNTDQN